MFEFEFEFDHGSKTEPTHRRAWQATRERSSKKIDPLRLDAIFPTSEVEKLAAYELVQVQLYHT